MFIILRNNKHQNKNCVYSIIISCIRIICYTMEKMCKCVSMPTLVLLSERSEDKSIMPCQAASTILQLLLVALSIEEMGFCLQHTKSKPETSCANIQIGSLTYLKSILIQVQASSMHLHPFAGILFV